MDDEIDIEEHDIFEHPQVKAVFPELSKIQIQVQTTGVPLFDEVSTCTEEYVNLLEERKERAEKEEDSRIEENLSNVGDEVPVCDTDENNYEENNEEQNNDDNNDEQKLSDEGKLEKEETLFISDSENSNPTNSEEKENIDDKEETEETATKIPENTLVDDILEISDDEVNETPNEVKLKQGFDINEISNKLRMIANAVKVRGSDSSRILVENVHEISDNEEHLDVENKDKESGNPIELVDEDLAGPTRRLVENYLEISDDEDGQLDVENKSDESENVDKARETDSIGRLEEGLDDGKVLKDNQEVDKILGENLENNDEILETISENDKITENVPEESDIGRLEEELDYGKVLKDSSEVDKILRVNLENNDELLEKISENDKILKNVPEDGETLQEDNEINDEASAIEEVLLEEVPENKTAEDVPEDTANLEESPENEIYRSPVNDSIFVEDPLLTEDCEINDVKDQVDQTDIEQELGGEDLQDPLLTEYSEINEVKDQVDQTDIEQELGGEDLHVPIKEEIDYIPIKEELDDDYEYYNVDYNLETSELPPEDIYHFKNKIILGSKPSRKINSVNDKTLVILEDWGEHLRQSQSYCQECKTLFTTPNALDSHKMLTHSLLAPIINRAVKSTAKSSLSLAKKSTTKIKNSARKRTSVNEHMNESTYCNHCDITFKDHTALIKHLYKLLPAKTFSCDTCEEKFQNQDDLVNHNKIHVKIEPRKILKAKKSDENPLLRNLLTKAAVLPELIKQNQSLIKKEPVDSEYIYKYKCMVCFEIFDQYHIARKHRLAHEGTEGIRKNSHILKRLISKVPNNLKKSKEKLKYEDDCDFEIGKEKATREKHNFIYREIVNASKSEESLFQLIPKSALFQCTKCSLHFTSSLGGVSHMTRNMCNTHNKNDRHNYSCPTCKKKLRKMDQECHTKQHELSNKLKIYKLTKNTNQRTLCKCSKCGVYFDCVLLKMHINKCGAIPTGKCQKCNILLAKHRLVEHNLKHELLHLKPKDFIFVDYVVINDKSKTIKAKTTPKTVKMDINPLTVKAKPMKKSIINKLTFEKDKIKLYYCKHCRSCTRSRTNAMTKKSHLSRKCLNKYRYNCYICEFCGLQIPLNIRSAHEALHTENNLTLSDFEFYDFTTLGRIVPSPPNYPSCKKCNINFLDRVTKKIHICGEDYDNCEICAEKFELSALKVHRPLHKLQQKTKSTREPKLLPELLMKYESLNAIWNVLFRCGCCEIVTDLYSKAVEHSRTHLKNESKTTNTIKCYICNLKFDESCWSRHSALHSRMTIKMKDFEIIIYSPKLLHDESWYKMFENLPQKKVRQIIDRSAFGEERSSKMSLVKDGRPEFTIYCCEDCKVAFDNNDIMDHVKSKCKPSTQVCVVCDIAFGNTKSLDIHKELHKKGIAKEEFRIVHFTKTPVGVQKNSVKGLTANKSRHVDTKPSVKGKKKRLYVLYKCLECSVCVHRPCNKTRHNCTPDNLKYFCNKCAQNFSVKQKAFHDEKHRTCPNFSAKYTTIINYQPNKKRIIKSSPKVGKYVAESECSDSDLSNFETSASTSSSRSKLTDKRKIQPVLTELPKSKERKTLNSSKHRNSIAENENDDQKAAKVYKCDCGLHYTSLRTIESHIEICSENSGISKENCSKCGLLFPTDVLVSHLCKHHSQDTIITVEEIHKKEANSTQEASETSPTKKHIKIYKCSDCKVYFLAQNTCYKHTLKHEKMDPRQYIECKICTLQFGLKSLPTHMTKHHETEFVLENVLVEEYHPSVGKDTPKIEIYLASERVNMQVSSSND